MVLLPPDLLWHVFAMFVGPGHYHYVAGTCHLFRAAYISAMADEDRNKTSYAIAAASLSCAELCEREAGDIHSLTIAASWKIPASQFERCEIQREVMEWLVLLAAGHGQVDILCIYHHFCDRAILYPRHDDFTHSVLLATGLNGHLNVFEFAERYIALREGRYCYFWGEACEIQIVLVGTGCVEVLDWIWLHSNN